MNWLKTFFAFLVSPIDFGDVPVDYTRSPCYVSKDVFYIRGDDGKTYVESSAGYLIQVKEDDVVIPEGNGYAWTAPSERPF
jgi:hypothetical protein